MKAVQLQFAQGFPGISRVPSLSSFVSLEFYPLVVAWTDTIISQPSAYLINSLGQN